jgi:hypothetical protein
MARPNADPTPPHLWFGVSALIAFAVYWMLSPSVSGFGDSSELTLALATNGAPHPTGYPLYILFGHPFVRVGHAMGLGWPRAAALWSALGAGVGLYFLQLLAWQLTGVAGRAGRRTRAAACVAVAAGFAFNPIWLERATLAEVYSWHVAWACATTIYFVGQFGATKDPSSGAASRVAVLWGVLVGIGLAHHRTSLLVSAPLSIALLWRVARERGVSRALAWSGMGACAALVPLASYGFVAWRAFHPALAQWPVLGPSWTSVIDHVSAIVYWDYFGYFAPDTDARLLLARAVYPWLFAGLGALVWIVWSAARKSDRTPFCAIAVSALLGTAVAFRYGVPDPQSYFLVPMALGLAALACPLATLVSTMVLPRSARVAMGAICAAGLVAWATHGTRKWLEARDTIVHNDGVVRYIWNELPDDSSMVFWPSDAYARLRENQIFRGEKRGLFVMNPNFLGYEFPRRRFLERFGFDPIEGFEIHPIAPGQPDEARRIRELDARLVLHVNSRAWVPVIYMEPERRILLRLRKSGPAAK